MYMPLDQVQAYDQLRALIHQKLCEKENLMEEEFHLFEMPLRKREKPCGVQFVLQGPRNVRLGGIWAFEHNTVYLYDARGIRYEKMQLKNRIDNYDPASENSAA